MKTISDSYSRLCGMLCSPSFDADLYSDFPSLCRSLGASPVDLSELLERELGVSGEELLRHFRPAGNNSF